MQVFETMRQADWHTFQILTKRPERAAQFNEQLPWQRNIWMGMQRGTADYAHRIDQLRQTSAHTKFLSIEPLLGSIPNLDLTGIDWVSSAENQVTEHGR